MRERPISLVVLAALFLAGCGGSFKGAPEPPYDIEDELAAIKAVYSPDRLPEFIVAPPDARTQIRNDIISARLYAIDLRYRDFEQNLNNEVRQSNFLLNLVSLGLSSSGAVIGGETTKSALAIADTILKGGKESFDRDILIDRTFQVLATQMRAERSRIRASIQKNLALPEARYPLGFALSQVQEYYQAGTLVGALTALTATVNAEAAAAIDEERGTIVLFAPNEVTENFKKCLAAGGRSLAAKAAAEAKEQFKAKTDAELPRSVGLEAIIGNPDMREIEKTVFLKFCKSDGTPI